MLKMSKDHKVAIATHASNIAYVLTPEEIFESMMWLLEDLEKPVINESRVYEYCIPKNTPKLIVSALVESGAFLSEVEAKRYIGAGKVHNYLGHLYQGDFYITLAEDEVRTIYCSPKHVVLRGI